MIKLPPQCDSTLKKQFDSFDTENAIRVTGSAIDPRYSVFRSKIPCIANGFGFWTGELPEFVSFLALKPVAYGSVSGNEAFRAWTDPTYRGKGFATELLEHAIAVGPIISDREGMTQGAFWLWRAQGSLCLEYVDAASGVVVQRDSIPPDDLFTTWDQGKRWHMLLRKRPHKD